MAVIYWVLCSNLWLSDIVYCLVDVKCGILRIDLQLSDIGYAYWVLIYIGYWVLTSDGHIL